MAGPFTREDFEHLVPSDKKLSTDWIRSLFARGAPAVYRGDALQWIGMPVGGIGAGQLYLGGDGRLWHWDIFNQHISTSWRGDHYARPLDPASAVDLGFTLKLGGASLPLARCSRIAFRGEYPIGIVEYREKEAAVTLEAFSPFIPLNTDDSSLPATVLRFTVKNLGRETLETELAGSLAKDGMVNRLVPGEGFTFLECAWEKPPPHPESDICFEDWNQESYAGWTVEGTAFGSGPIGKSAIPAYQADVGGDTERVVNSHATAPGEDVGAMDNATGKLISRPFKIARKFITFWMGGGNNPGKTCLNLVLDGKVVRSATGHNNNRMTLQGFDARKWMGREAHLEIVDAQQGGWGNIGVGRIVFSDRRPGVDKPESAPDFGTMGLALLGPGKGLSRELTLAPGQSAVVTFVVTWHFPNLLMGKLPGGRYYATKFDSALAVAAYVAGNFDRLYGETKRWRDTWYDSTLPYWFLDRTMVNTSTLATSTCYRFKNGRFYGYEGVGCCGGTCTHVWHYAHAPARLFPDLERYLREEVDFGLALQPDGAIHFRGEFNGIPAVDGQAGSILRAYREHQMSADSAFLQRIWPKVKRATDWLIVQDGNGDGLLEGAQHNTLDANWFGPVAWLSGLYLSALRAAEAMATEMGDGAYAEQCRAICEPGLKKLVDELFDGEYFINKSSPQHPKAINSGTGCEIDQVMGQSWAWQVGLPRVLPESETKSALRSLWRYNFTPDVGPYRAVHKRGRWYAMPGEAGLLMCTFPRTDWDARKAVGGGGGAPSGYFNECMSGFEYQVAGHMIREGLVQEGLAVARAVHDRYHPSRRNPFNEIECGDHYARAMASYGVYLAACGFEYHGPKGHIGFAPRLTPDNFKAAFTGAEGWGTFSQQRTGNGMKAAVAVKYGSLRLSSIRLALPDGMKAKGVAVKVGGSASAGVTLGQEGDRILVTLKEPVRVTAGETMAINVG